jgi:hypothetical protein
MNVYVWMSTVCFKKYKKSGIPQPNFFNIAAYRNDTFFVVAFLKNVISVVCNYFRRGFWLTKMSFFTDRAFTPHFLERSVGLDKMLVNVSQNNSSQNYKSFYTTHKKYINTLLWTVGILKKVKLNWTFFPLNRLAVFVKKPI